MGERKELRLLPGVRHVVDEAADEVYGIVHAFLAQHLANPEDVKGASDGGEDRGRPN